MALLLAGVISGIGAVMSSKNANKGAKANAKSSEKQTLLQGDEDRKTLAFKGLLEDFYNQKSRYRKAQGLANYTAFAKSQGSSGMASLDRLTNFVSPNQIKDPGEVPNPQLNFQNASSQYGGALPLPKK